MREAAFVRKNRERWDAFEKLLMAERKPDPDQLSDLFIQLTDDLAFARTFFPKSKTAIFLNNLAVKVHRAIYRNRKEKSNRFVTFWKEELPLIVGQHHRQLFYSFVFFGVAMLMGAFSAAHDESFVRLILGDGYVNMTLENIKKNDPMAVYKSQGELDMFAAITLNNVMVSFRAFAAGLLFSVGTVFMLFYNGVMVGSFQYFFHTKGLLLDSALTIWIHGTLEISAIVIAGGAGLVMGNSILFPGSYPRLTSFRRGAKNGLKIIIGLVPIFVIAGFLEGFVTRHTEFPVIVKAGIIFISASFIIGYFIIYPLRLTNKLDKAVNESIELKKQ